MSAVRCLFVQGQSGSIMDYTPRNVFDLGAFVGDLTLEEDTSRYGCYNTGKKSVFLSSFLYMLKFGTFSCLHFSFLSLQVDFYMLICWM